MIRGDVVVSASSAEASSPPEEDGGAVSLNESKSKRGTLACSNCRRQKLRCDYAERVAKEGSPLCSRCLRLGKECIAVKGLRGRQTGSKNKPKAKIEPPSVSPELAVSRNAVAHTEESYDVETVPTPAEQLELQNPLAVLAEASHVASTPVLPTVDLPMQPARPSELIIGPETPHLGLRIDRSVLQEGLNMILEPISESLARTRPPSRDQYFAQRPQGEGQRDIGAHLDPIDLHLLEMEDVERLFGSFFAQDNPCAPVLDVELHTPAYCRARSALLLSAICLTAAQMTAGEASITYRLRKHVQFLRQEIYIHDYRSLEILQGFDVLALWPILHDHVNEDRSNLSLAHAIAIAYELGLDREGRHVATPGDWTIQEQREKRSRERAMLSLYIWDRTSSAATGSTWMLPDSFLPSGIKNWDLHALATVGDSKILHHAFLRRETSAIQVILRREISKGGDLSSIPRLLLELYHDRLGTRWYADFQQRVRAGAIPSTQEANMRILYHVSCVWVLATGLPYTTRDESSTNLIAALQNAALEACEYTVVQQESLNHAPFNLAVLVLYAALLALKLGQAHGQPEALAALLGLLAQVARWLERTGSTPSHRLGNNALYGQHLMLCLRAAAHASQPSTVSNVPMNDVSMGYNDEFLTLDWLSSALPVDVAQAMSEWMPVDSDWEFTAR